MDIRPLTKEEQRFAKENHNLVKKFLFQKDLPESVFYDVVIFGYLRAVQEYCEKPRLRKYAFSTLSWKRMQSAMSNYCQYLSRQKRSAVTVSFEERLDDEEGLCLKDVIGQQDPLMRAFETELILHALASKLPRQTMNIILMKLNRARMHDIAKAERLTFHDINRILADSYDTIVEVCYGKQANRKEDI